MKKIYKFIEIFRWEEEQRKGGRTRKNKKKLVGERREKDKKKINIFLSIQYSIYKKYELKINQNKKDSFQIIFSLVLMPYLLT